MPDSILTLADVAGLLKAAGKTVYRELPLMPDPPIKIGMKAAHPGAFIRREIFGELKLSVAKAASPAGMALRIEKAFGVSMETLIGMQAWHDIPAMRGRAKQIDARRFAAA